MSRIPSAANERAGAIAGATCRAWSGLLWIADAGGATTALFLLSVGGGLFAVAEVHVLRRLIETAQQVVEGDGSLDDRPLVGW